MKTKKRPLTRSSFWMIDFDKAIENDPRLRQFDDEYNEQNGYVLDDYKEYAAWDTDDFEDVVREDYMVDD